MFSFITHTGTKRIIHLKWKNFHGGQVHIQRINYDQSLTENRSQEAAKLTERPWRTLLKTLEFFLTVVQQVHCQGWRSDSLWNSTCQVWHWVCRKSSIKQKRQNTDPVVLLLFCAWFSRISCFGDENGIRIWKIVFTTQPLNMINNHAD